MWICYKRKQKNYLSATVIVAIFYQAIYINLGHSKESLILSLVYIALVWIIIKLYSIRINKEHNENLLKSIRDEYEKVEAQLKDKK